MPWGGFHREGLPNVGAPGHPGCIAGYLGGTPAHKDGACDRPPVRLEHRDDLAQLGTYAGAGIPPVERVVGVTPANRLVPRCEEHRGIGKNRLVIRTRERRRLEREGETLGELDQNAAGSGRSRQRRADRLSPGPAPPTPAGTPP